MASSRPFQSSRLLYRAVEAESDASFILEIQHDAIGYTNSNATLHKPQSKKSSEKFLKYLSEEALIGVVICIQPTTSIPEPTPIGQISLRGNPPAMAHHRFAEIGIDVLPEYQGKGYGSEAIEWILEWAFETAGLHRVNIRCFSWNVGARRLYARLGFKEESVQRETLFHRGKFWDDIGFGMLEWEWRERKGKA